MYDGKIINSSPKNKSTVFNFQETSFNLNKYKTKTTTTPKIQEIKSLDVINCLVTLSKGLSLKFENFSCTNNIYKELSRELYKRAFLPFYIPLISVIASFLILNSHNNLSYRKSKLFIFITGVFLSILSQVSVNFITEKKMINYLILSLLPIFIFMSFIFFKIKMKVSS